MSSTTRRLTFALGLLSLPLVTVDAQRFRRGQITVAEARAILGANPVAIPGYPVEFFRLNGRAILVQQTLDSSSGEFISFTEDRQGPPMWSNFRSPNTDNTAQAVDQAGSYPRLWSYDDARDGYRKVGDVSVHWLGAHWTKTVPRDLLDKLAPIPD